MSPFRFLRREKGISCCLHWYPSLSLKETKNAQKSKVRWNYRLVTKPVSEERLFGDQHQVRKSCSCIFRVFVESMDLSVSTGDMETDGKGRTGVSTALRHLASTIQVVFSLPIRSLNRPSALGNSKTARTKRTDEVILRSPLLISVSMTVKGIGQSTCQAKRARPFRSIIYCRISPTFLSNYLAFVMLLGTISCYCCKLVLGGFGLLSLVPAVSHEKVCFREKGLGWVFCFVFWQDALLH